MKYKIGTRGSRLALTQAEYVQARLAKEYPEHEFEIRVIRTKGDVVLDKPLHEIGDKGVFVREIEEKLLDGEIDIGVHSMKDMPSLPAHGLTFTKSWKREDPRDALILREKKSLEELSGGAVIGTGSRRREFQLKRLRPDLQVVNIRGNVDTRLRKMEEEKLDGIILAAAGLNRLGMQDKITRYLEPEEMIPAPAQGILALEIREGDKETARLLDALHDAQTAEEMRAERGFLQNIGGDCHVPVGAVCTKTGDNSLRLSAMFGNESGSRQAYVSVCGTDPEEIAREAAFQIRRRMAGLVSLVGAGPGDPGLITVKGFEKIREADCIIYDRLAAPQLLDEAKPGCEKIYVGKADRRHTMKQEDINRLLVKKSMEYEHTVRLKGGDVYVFGRGGEEGLFLKENGVPFEIVPGVTSAIAGLAYAGIPITHRGTALGFHVVTAHDKRDELADIDFEALARGKETCVFLMGLGKLGEITQRLLEAGMARDTLAAVISCATTPAQRTCVSDLEHIAEEVKNVGLVSPAMIVVGNVVSLREHLNFFEERPLSKKRYLIPKIGEKCTRLKELLEAQGAAADEIQVGEIIDSQRTFTREELETVDWLVFTSKNGVEAFFKCFAKSGLDMRSLAGCRIAAIGGKTAEELKNHGLYADLVPDAFHSDALAEALKQKLVLPDKTHSEDGSQAMHPQGSYTSSDKTDPKGSPQDVPPHGRQTSFNKVWYLKAGNADSHLKQALEEVCRFEEIVVYENRVVEPKTEEILHLQGYDGILFTCASSAERLIGVLGTEWGKCRAYSIGPKTTARLKALGIEHVEEAGENSYEGLVKMLLQPGTFPPYTIKNKKPDLPEKILEALQGAGEKFNLDQIILFGSRARGDNFERSDIDLALRAKDAKQYYEILDYIEEIETLLIFDVVDMNSSAFSRDLCEEIKRDGVLIYEKI